MGGSARAGGPAAAGMSSLSASGQQQWSRGERNGQAAGECLQHLQGRQKHPLGCGLVNLGNTCYMSAYLQVLVRVPAFVVALLRLPAGALKGSGDKGAKGPSNESATVTAEEVEDKVVGELQRVTASLLLSVRPSVQPQGLLTALPPFFQGGCQQDAHEFGRYLLSCVQGRSERLEKRALSAAEGASARQARQHQHPACPTQPPLPGCHRDPSMVFQGKMRTRVTCRACGTRSDRGEAFSDLSLPVPAGSRRPASARGEEFATTSGKEIHQHAERGREIKSSEMTPSMESGVSDNDSGSVSAAAGGGRRSEEEGAEDQERGLMLTDLLGQMLEAEEMTGSEQYWCEVCGCKRDAIRRSYLEALPEIAQITLLRFSDSASRTKVCRKVELPLSILLPHCPLRVGPERADSRVPGRSETVSDVRMGDGLTVKDRAEEGQETWGEEKTGLRGAGRSAEENTGCEGEGDGKVAYDLLAVVTHTGKSTSSGHYYSFVRHPGHGGWLQCDDSSVSDSSFERAITPVTENETPYLLFYVRSDGGISEGGSQADVNAAVRGAVPAALRAEVEADNRRAKHSSIASVGTRSSMGPDGGGGGSGGAGGFDSAGGGPGLGPSGPTWGMA